MNMMTTDWVEQAEDLPFDALARMGLPLIEQQRPRPPAWMIAPSFRAEPAAIMSGGTDPQAGSASAAMQPYRSIRDVPRRVR
ncbi:hypothetical protein HY78_03190 [Rhizorhabdus wittichii DC-6]|uniref:Uncharacterized protein n=2 Tax=Rhizorhabdus wittichii TaxID=160791 RepID=A0A9J9LEH3_RHIWR|nr:hypothetical protein [Rhizorhabdus wittichii]ABQ70727.1 hypothetical protein Swit_4389 [Rhizorhabdus wittichii RW1]ARR52526.1 hypothetical protein HY78_03190 [Rhizorhabdus wittichii DC-6]QTH23770.1 hypothetical protein HRJ34_09810 [Rhizorhabdus wittichii]